MRGAHRSRTEIARQLDQTRAAPGRRALDSADGRSHHQKPRLPGLRPTAASKSTAERTRPIVLDGRVAGRQPRARPRCRAQQKTEPARWHRPLRGMPLRPRTGKSRFGGTGGEDVLGYRCRTAHTAGVCLEPASINARKLERYVEAVWREQMAQEALTVQHDSDALQAAAEALSEAEDELAAFAAD